MRIQDKKQPFCFACRTGDEWGFCDRLKCLPQKGQTLSVCTYILKENYSQKHDT